MPFYQKRGNIPNKRHIQMKDVSENLYWEELISREGFNSLYSNVYHLNPPTTVEAIGDWAPIQLESQTGPHKNRHIRTGELKSKGDPISARIPLLFNQDTIIHKAHVDQSMDYLYRNGHYDEVLFIHTGKGEFLSNFGQLELKPGDYVVIPRGVIWQIKIVEPMRILVVESSGPVETLDTESAMGKFFFTLTAAIAEMERQIVSERTKAALQYKRANGEKTGGDVPFGYQANNGTLTPDRQEQHIIKLIRKLKDAGHSLREIGHELRKRGYKSKTGKDSWNPKTVAAILERAA